MDPLADRLARGDESAFAELYDACAQRLYRYAYHRLGDPEAAADVLQETFLRTAQAGRRLRKVRDIHAYIFQIARNEMRRCMSKRCGQPIENTDASMSWMDTNIGALESTEVVHAALAHLDDLSREVVELKIFGELTFKAIATALQLPQGTVATRYRRALQQLGSIFQRESP